MKSRFSVYVLLSVILLVSGLTCLYVFSRPESPERITGKVTGRLEREIHLMDEHARELVAELEENASFSLPHSEKFSFYVVANYKIIRWSDHRYVPSVASLINETGLKLLREGNSDYLAKTWPISPGRFLVGIVPLYRKYPITNNYLNPEWNSSLFPRGTIQIHDPQSENGHPVCIDDDCPFKISFHPESLGVNEGGRITGVILITAGIVIALIFVYLIARSAFSPDIVFCVLLFATGIARYGMTTLDFPSGIISGNLFNHLVFASSDLNSSLGDLLLNEIALFFLCFYLFKNYPNFRSFHVVRSYKLAAWAMSITMAVLIFFAMLFPFVVVQTIYNNSAIALAISESLQFDGLRIAAMAAVVIAGICTFLFSHCCIRLLIGDHHKIRIIISFVLGLAIFVVINQYTGQVYLSSLLVGGAYFTIVYLLKLTASLRRLSFATFTYMFVSIFFMSANAGYAMHHFSWREKIDNMFRFGSNYIIDRDYFAEYLLAELGDRVKNDVFIQSRVATPFLSKDAVKQKIRQVFLPSYFNKFDLEIYTFNASGQPSDNRTGFTMASLLSTYSQESSRTDYEGIYFLTSPTADISQRYLVVIPMTWMKSAVGFVAMEFSLKKVIPDNVYPELLVDNRFLENFRAEEVSYGVFANGKLAYSSGPFNYETLFNTEWFGDPALHTRGIVANGFDHIAEEDDAGRIAIVSSRQTPFAYSIANFSFLLVIGLGTTLLFILLQSVSSYMDGGKLYFASRIQLFLNLAFFLPLIIVSIMSLRVTNRSSENQILDEYLGKTRNFAEQVSGELHRHLVSSYEPLSNFSSQLTDLTTLTNLEANVYYVTGTLLATSQPLIFENKLLSEYLNPSAFEQIRRGTNLLIESEKVGSLEYYTAYAALKAPSSGAVIGIVAVPFFQSVYSAERIQMNVLANILNIFALIFIILVGLSYFVTQWLTFPLTFITQSLRRTSLNRTNQPLVWKSDDEIGLMVKEYNQMLYSLSESKAELEQTQRERAWRDMAQQVAHEIKNPLTPMKLTLQQLERAIENGKAGPDKLQKAVSSLLTQVDTLNDIASSFSAFAKMPVPVTKPLDLIGLLKRIVDLHSHSGNLRFESHARECWVRGDEQLLGRAFSNLILNALQSARAGETVAVVIRSEVKQDNVMISFIDNGPGIEPHIAERIFIPHFTTKKSGSGLGLAIAKQAMEHMHGKLWFVTSPETGTTFFVELPLSTETN